MAASLPGGGDAVVEMYKAALVAPRGGQARPSKERQKRSKKDKKGKVRERRAGGWLHGCARFVGKRHYTTR